MIDGGVVNSDGDRFRMLGSSSTRLAMIEG